jgi:FMN-dependent NADH-azoreductase
LKAVFGFLGVTQLEVVRAEGVKGGPEAAERALTSADVQIAVLEP